jgi:hypothetical protein
MTGTCPDLLAALHQRRRDLELDAMAVKSRIAEVNDMIELIEQPQRRRRRRTEPAEPTQHVPGAALHPPQPSSPDELFPAPQDTQEIAQ